MLFFPVFSNSCKGNKVFHHNHAAYQSKLSFTQKKKKMLQRYIFYTIAKDPDPNNGLKIQQNLLSLILLPLAIYLSENDLLNMSCFS